MKINLNKIIEIIKKVLKIIRNIGIFLILSLLIVFAYLIFYDIESSTASNLKENVTIEEYQYLGRNVFVIKSSEEGNAIKSNKTIIYLHGRSICTRNN